MKNDDKLAPERDFKRTLQVLIVENSEIDRLVLVNMLSKVPYGSFQISSADSLTQAFQILKTAPIDVVLLDLNIQDSKGIDTLRRLHKRYSHIPVVVNTGEYQDDLGLLAVTMGAQDYLIKGMYKAYGLVKALYYAIERKRGEMELRNALTELKETQSHLIRAEKMNVLGGVASGVAHEVKNPLATILYGVEYLNTALTQRDDKIELTLKSMREATLKANEIIKDLLDFSSITDLKQGWCSVEEIIEKSLMLTHHQCEKGQVTVQKIFEPDLPKLFIDRNRVEQVIVDLILNALLAMKGLGGELVIRAARKPFDDGDIRTTANIDSSIKNGDPVVIIDLEDSGNGIPEHVLDKIFDPFFTTRRADGGVGLGLSIARTIMSTHDGMIDLSNRTPRGARARLIFKLEGDARGTKEHSHY